MNTYTPEKCEVCHQSKTYIIGLDRGSAEIVKAIATAVSAKGLNCVHPRREIEGFGLTSNQVGNLSRPRFHGLIAKVKGNPGNYCLTHKGAKFLNNEEVPRYAIISKAEGHQIGYWNTTEAQNWCTIRELLGEDARWQGFNYEIVLGMVVPKSQKEPAENQGSML